MELNERMKTILSAVVHRYITTAEPVSSAIIAEKYNLDLSTATIRHEMYLLEKNDYLWQPHTSSGRIPTDKGYRFYVDNLVVKNYLEDWNDCDNLCTHAVGALVSAYPGLAGRIVKWTEHKKFIVRRAAAVAFIFPVKRGEFHKTAFDIAGRLMYDENDIVRKGYGWMLKSLSESDREAVFKYVMRNKKIMPRTALRYAIEKLPREMRVKCIKKMEDKMKKTAVMCCLLCVFSFSGLYAEKASVINKEGSPYELSLNAEAGFVSVLSHSIKFGEDGTAFDYVKEGGQGVLFPFNRFTAELRLFDVHSLVFIYQPLEIVSVITAERPLQFYDTSFYEGDVMDVKYGFSFYRASYLWYFLKEGKNELGIGLSLQIRNASIYFKSAKGSYGMVTENVGPVPILKLAGKYHFENGFWAAVDADGFYASSEFFNGADYFFTGAIWDISSRIGIELDNGISPYLNLRWLGGGGEGTSQSEDAQGDGYTKNWLSTFSLTLGVDFK